MLFNASQVTMATSEISQQTSLTKAEQERGQRIAIRSCIPGILFQLGSINSVIVATFYVSIGMSARQIGILTSLISLCIFGQLITSIFAEHWGRKFILIFFSGIYTIIACFLPLLPFLMLWKGSSITITATIILMVLLNFAFNMGVSTWFAILKEYADTGSRGAFFSRLRITWGTISLLFFLVVWIFFSGGTGNIPMMGFAAIFALAAISGWIRWWIVRPMPTISTSVPQHGIAHSTWLALREMAGNSALRQHAFFYSAFAIVFNIINPFLVFYLKTHLALADSQVNMMWFFWQLGGLGGLWWFGQRLDRVGPQVIYYWTTGIMAVTLISLAFIRPGLGYLPAILAVIFCIKGFSEFGFGLANTDSILFSAGGRNPSLTIVIVGVINTGFGALAQYWGGYLLDTFKTLTVHFTLRAWNIFDLIFLGAAISMAVLVFIRRLVRPPPRSVSQAE